MLDVGTTGIKAFVFDGDCRVIAKAYQTIKKARPRRGWVEQDPMEILRVSIAVLRKAVKDSGIAPSSIRGMGITNQREATVLWKKTTGKPVYPIIGWEDSRTRRFCQTFSKRDQEAVRRMTGLPIDSYFSASKIHWILNRVQGTRELADDGDLAFGTVDSWLIWNLCEGRPHYTDETNASRTLLFNIHTRHWDGSLLKRFDVPKSVLPFVQPSRARFGVLDNMVLGADIPILAVCGDQQASTYAAIRSASSRHSVKVTYGTGTFVVQVHGKSFFSHPPFFTTLVPDMTMASFALEGKIEGSSEAVTRLLGNSTKLRMYLKKLAEKADALIKQLPTQPKQIIADGGIARDGIIVGLQEEISGIPTCLQSTYDGTALGTALLVWDAIKLPRENET